jgi:glycosyltransferase involved in cell wall biosynthesis
VITDPDRRGAQVFATDLADGLAALGGSGAVVALGPGDHPDGLLVPVLGPSRRSIRTLRALRREARRYDVVVAHGSTSLFAASTALAGTGVPFVYRQISDPLHWAASPGRRARVALMIRRAARVVALSDHAADVLVRHYRLDRDEIAVVPTAVPADRFEPPRAEDTARARRQHRLSEDRPVLLYLGALVPEKGVDLAIRALAAAPRAHLLVAGDGEARADLEHLAARVAPDLVRFTGSVDRPISALHAADVFVFPSRGGDSVPAALIEAGLVGLPVVSTPVGSISDVVVDGRTGRIVPIADQAALDAAVAELLADPELRRGYGDAARRHCLERFTIEAVAPRWMEVLGEVAARTGTARRGGRQQPAR